MREWAPWRSGMNSLTHVYAHRDGYVKGSVFCHPCVLPPWHRKYRSAKWRRKKPMTLIRLEIEGTFSIHCCFQSKSTLAPEILHLLIYIKLLHDWVNTKKFSLLSKSRSFSDLSCVLLACLIASEVISGKIWTFFNRVEFFLACCFIVSGTFSLKEM